MRLGFRGDAIETSFSVVAHSDYFAAIARNSIFLLIFLQIRADSVFDED